MVRSDLLARPFSIAFYKDSVYWTQWVPQAVRKAAASGAGGIRTVTTQLSQPPAHIVVRTCPLLL